MSFMRSFFQHINEIAQAEPNTEAPSAPAPAADAPEPPGTSETWVDVVVSPRVATIEVGGQQQFTASAVDSNGAQRDITTRVVWVSSAPEDVSIDANGLATAHRARGVQLTAKDPDTDSRGFADVEVTGDQSQVLLSLKISPADATIEAGGRSQFSAKGQYADRSTKDLTNLVWTSSDPAVVTVDNTGLAVAQNVKGFARITATDPTVADMSEHVNVTVSVDGKKPPKPPKLKSITINPGNAQVAGGEQQQFEATGVYADFSSKDVTKLVRWSAKDNAIVLIDPNSGLASAQRGQGTTRIEATDPDTAVFAGADITVTAVGATPTGDEPPAAQEPELQSPEPPTEEPTTEVPPVDEPNSIEPAAEDQTPDDPATTSDLKSITLSPERIVIPIGQKHQLNATGEYADGSTQDLTNAVKWQCADADIATVGVNDGLACGLKEGQAMIVAESSDGITASHWVNVFVTTDETPVLLAIEIQPKKSTIVGGQEQRLLVTGTYSDGSSTDVTNLVQWTSANDGFATIADDGLVTARRPARSVTVKITAMDPAGRAAPDSVEITLEVAEDGIPPDAEDNATVEELWIEPENPTLAVGDTLQIQIQAFYSDERIEDITKEVVWIYDRNLVSVDDNGLLTALHEGGPMELEATYVEVDKAVLTNVTISGDEEEGEGEGEGEGDEQQGELPVLQSITISPAEAEIAIGEQQPFSAMGTYSDGSSRDVTNIVDWVCNSLDHIEVDATGLATAQSEEGTVEVTAMDAETGVTASVNVMVTAGDIIDPFADGVENETEESPPAVLQSIRVDPANAALNAGEKLPFRATGLYVNGAERDLSSTVVWLSKHPDILTIGKDGLATAQRKAGTAEITATDIASNLTGSTTVIVTKGRGILRKEFSRVMTAAERSEAQSVYQDSIDYGKITIVSGGVGALGAAGRTIGNKIVLAPEYFQENSTELTADGMVTLIHELGHVWQFQHGGLAYIPNALGAQLKSKVKTGKIDGAYEWWVAYNAKTPWEEWNPEQQAAAMEDYYASKKRIEAGVSPEEGEAPDEDIVAALEPYVAKARAGEGAP